MNVFGDVDLIVSTEQAKTVAEAIRIINQDIIKEIFLTIVMLDGTHHTLTVHDYLINWCNDNVA